eukprot:2827934-Rhodomonas_salina.1
MQIRKFQSAHQDQVRDKRLKLQRQKILAADGKTDDSSKGGETPTNKLSFPVSYFSGWYDNNGEWPDDVGYWGHHTNIVSDHLHNEEFEDMLNQCKGSTTCSALLGKEFWWLYDQPWRKCSETTDWACIPYYCPSNQVNSPSLRHGTVYAITGTEIPYRLRHTRTSIAVSGTDQELAGTRRGPRHANLSRETRCKLSSGMTCGAGTLAARSGRCAANSSPISVQFVLGAWAPAIDFAATAKAPDA